MTQLLLPASHRIRDDSGVFWEYTEIKIIPERKDPYAQAEVSDRRGRGHTRGAQPLERGCSHSDIPDAAGDCGSGEAEQEDIRRSVTAQRHRHDLRQLLDVAVAEADRLHDRPEH